MDVKALACALPAELGLPLSRLSSADIAREAVRRGIVASISGVTIWRWLSADAIRPWSSRSWLSPRDPHFADRAGCVIDLYHGLWDDRPLEPDEYVICADEKTSMQARKRASAGRPGPPASDGWSRTTSAKARWLTWPHGTYAGQRCSGCASAKRASNPSVTWSTW